MNPNDDLKSLWSKQTVPAAENPQELIQKANQFKRKHLIQTLVGTGLLIATAGFIGWCWYFFQPELITTKIGMTLLIVSISAFVISQNKVVLQLKQLDMQTALNKHLEQLLEFKKQQRFMQRTLLTIYYVCLSFGIALYMIEYTAKMPLVWATFAYGLTFAWIGFNWFYLRPKTIQKQQKKMDMLINRFKNINDQLQEN